MIGASAIVVYSSGTDPMKRTFIWASWLTSLGGWCWFFMVAHISLLQVYGADDMPISRFDGRGYGDWKATGTAFQKGPASGDIANQSKRGQWL